MMRRTALISLVLALIVATLTVDQSLGLTIKKESNNKRILTVGISVYMDRACRKPLTSIDWGVLSPGSVKSITVYIKNTGSTAVTLLLSTENWSPKDASGYFSLTWNYGGQLILPGKVLGLTLTLMVSPNASGVSSFNFDIIITGVALSST